MPKWIYLFEEGSADMRDILGGKGAGLCEMTRIGLPVPPGFVISTKACNSYLKSQRMPPGLKKQVREALASLESKVGRKFGDKSNPLLVSVRSGARVSMPGMMDTILNIGLNDETVLGLASATGNERFAYDAYRRLLQLYGKIVLDIDGRKFESILDTFKDKTPGKADTDLTTDHLRLIVKEFLDLIKAEAGRPFPQDPFEQLDSAVTAVFKSWNGKPAVDYRNFHKIPHNLGTAATIQAMVFGNIGSDSGTGVAFTRNPATGEKELYGEYLPLAQGEDVVSGIRTPKKISELKGDNAGVYQQFEAVASLLERHYRDVQDLEFTVERGKLWMLQTRTAKRAAMAAVKIAVDMAREGLITNEEALLRVEPSQVYQLLLPRFDETSKEDARRQGKYLAKGLNASPGAASGIVVFDPDEAERLGRDEKKPVILVRTETSPDDVHGMLHARGILTSRGGATSHAAVVARGLGLPCVAGCEALKVEEESGFFLCSEMRIEKGEFISIDGATGEVFLGLLPTIEPEFEKERDLVTLLQWADEIRRLQVWANADYPRDAERARRFGAQGIGLCRTEHMFFEQERLPFVQKMILAESAEERHEALQKLLPIQRSDFVGIFRAMDGLPVVIRLIDPPLHEFLPKYEELIVQVNTLRLLAAQSATSIVEVMARADEVLAKEIEEAGKGDFRAGVRRLLAEKERLLRAVARMREQNPMLGLRGCRLGIMMPEVTEMQVRAIFEAACTLKKEGLEVKPEIMIPLVGHVNELRIEREDLERVAKKVMEEQGVQVDYKFGTMIEVPRAALTANEIAKYAEFFSFGTNDLTQTTFGYSRDDAEGKFLLDYVERGILPANPFQVLDRSGVGILMRIAVERGRKVRPNIKLGICGEHGGDPQSIEFCHGLGLDYVSCSPFRVPVARLAAAHASLSASKAEKVD